MKNSLVILFCFGAFGYSQNSIIDSIPLKLIPVAEPVFGIIWNPWKPPYDPPPIIQPWPDVPFVWDFNWTGITLWIQPPCGDTYHDNGQLSSRIECVDSVMHGKAIYWDETGHKTHESTYAEGHQIKSKSYDSRGRVTALSHYDYSGNYHGVCIESDYANSTKTVTHYEHGIKEGWLEFYEYGHLVSKDNYHADILVEEWDYYSESEIPYAYYKYSGIGGHMVEQRQYNENGKLVHLSTSDTLGIVSHTKSWNYDGTLMYETHVWEDDAGIHSTTKQWNENGILTFDHYYLNNVPQGTFLESYDVESGIKKLTHYENGRVLKAENFKNDFLETEAFYKDGNHTHTVSWFENGDTARHFSVLPQMGIEKKWNQQGTVITWYTSINAYQHFKGNGFYTLNDTLFVIAASENPVEHTPIKRWVIYAGDTLREDYIKNSTGITYTNSAVIFASNRYVAHAGSYSKHGVWKYYQGNQLESAITYNHGVKSGRSVYYTTTDTSSQLRAVGHYFNGQKQGEWIFYAPNGKRTETYEHGLLNGQQVNYDSLGRVNGECMYEHNVKQGVCVTYHPKNKWSSVPTAASKTIYENGKLNGWAIYYNDAGQVILEGLYENNVRVKTWYQYTYEADDSAKRTKIHYKNAEQEV